MDAKDIRNLQEAYLEVYSSPEELDEATAMAKRGLDEPAIRTQIARNSGGGQAADRATALADRPTYGQRGVNPQARQRLAATQRGDFRNTTSSSPGLHGYGHKSDDPEVKAKQAARGAQRGALTPNEKKKLNREQVDLYDIILSHLLDEGYADTEKAALAIMTNMSEEWIKSVYEPEGEVIDELTRYAEKTGKKFTTLRKSVTGGNPEVAARNKLPGYNYGGSRQEPKERGKKPPSPSEEAKKKGLLTPYQHKAALIRNSKGKAKEFKMDTKRT